MIHPTMQSFYCNIVTNKETNMSRKSKTQNPSIEAAVEVAETLTIVQASAVSGLSEQYIRKAIRSGKLTTTMVPVKEGSSTTRHEIPVAAFEAWRQSAGSHSRREDGRSKFVLYMNADEQAALEALANDGQFTGLFSRANIKAEGEPTE
jgi:hypothetical protein